VPVILVASHTALGTAQAAGSAPAAETGIEKADPIKGKAIYERSCAACHGADGSGALPGTSDFETADRIFAVGWEVVFRRSRDGYQSPGSPMAMPARGGDSSRTDEDLWNALAYIRQAFRKGQ
jgi:cytochrome c5